MSLISILSTFKGLRSKITKSVRFPVLIEPLLSSLKYEYAEYHANYLYRGHISQRWILFCFKNFYSHTFFAVNLIKEKTGLFHEKQLYYECNFFVTFRSVVLHIF